MQSILTLENLSVGVAVLAAIVLVAWICFDVRRMRAVDAALKAAKTAVPEFRPSRLGSHDAGRDFSPLEEFETSLDRWDLRDARPHDSRDHHPL